jgi:hypothetical protein
VPGFVREIVEEVAFQARDDARVDKHSGVSQRLPISLLEDVLSNAERRALEAGDVRPTARASDLYAGLAAITGKLELEYEGELKGGEAVARELVRRAIGQVFTRRSADLDLAEVVSYFEADQALKVPDDVATDALLERVRPVPGLLDAASRLARARRASTSPSPPSSCSRAWWRSARSPAPRSAATWPPEADAAGRGRGASALELMPCRSRATRSTRRRSTTSTWPSSCVCCKTACSSRASTRNPWDPDPDARQTMEDLYQAIAEALVANDLIDEATLAEALEADDWMNTELGRVVRELAQRLEREGYLRPATVSWRPRPGGGTAAPAAAIRAAPPSSSPTRRSTSSATAPSRTCWAPPGRPAIGAHDTDRRTTGVEASGETKPYSLRRRAQPRRGRDLQERRQRGLDDGRLAARGVGPDGGAAPSTTRRARRW